MSASARPVDLSATAIEAEIARAGGGPRPIVVREVTVSTNDDAKRAALEGAPAGAAFLADAQTGGRGRRGNAWHSPPGDNLYLSVLLGSGADVAALVGSPLTLVLGAAIAGALEQTGIRATGGGALRNGVIKPHETIGVKWPNDLVVRGRKLAGILVEGQHRGRELVSLVAGVGVNVRTTRFPAELAETATSLALEGAADLDRARVAALVLVAIGRAVAAMQGAGGEQRIATALDDVRARDVLRGAYVEVGSLDDPTRATRGRAVGIDAAGRLLVALPDGTAVAIDSGHVASWTRPRA